ncbi:hypothetical protein PIB30_073533 [Stylosanthes scabra]|uniref:Uncharacterized protein n=1 Tax=Stylosanthes scabra TaxID=79078 RepID=A0ABU6UN76_9FABA|nr:hypothetical protein [Stylosanthes scabra]
MFHFCQQFLEVRTTELYAKVDNVVASSGRSTPHPEILPCLNSATPVSPNMSHKACQPDPLVDEVLRGNDSDEDPTMIDNDSDDDGGYHSCAQDVSSSSGTHQYSPHGSTLNLEA